MCYDGEYLAEINSFEEYVQFVKEYSEKNKCEIWYRGQRDNRWELKPNIYRNAKMDINPKGEVSQLKYKLVNFKDEFDKLKEEILNKKLFDFSELNDFQTMFVAQHYGLLTPILDWTTDPLVALFFALDNYEPEEDSFPVIYFFKPGQCNSNSWIRYGNGRDITEPLCIDEHDECFDVWVSDLNNTPANHIPIAIYSKMDFSHRICRQSGKFTLHGAVGPLNYRWNNIDIKGEKLAYVIKINPKAVDEMKKYVLALDITKQSIYRGKSDLDVVCKQLRNESLKAFEENISKANDTLKYIKK